MPRLRRMGHRTFQCLHSSVVLEQVSDSRLDSSVQVRECWRRQYESENTNRSTNTSLVSSASGGIRGHKGAAFELYIYISNGHQS